MVPLDEQFNILKEKKKYHEQKRNEVVFNNERQKFKKQMLNENKINN